MSLLRALDNGPHLHRNRGTRLDYTIPHKREYDLAVGTEQVIAAIIHLVYHVQVGDAAESLLYHRIHTLGVNSVRPCMASLGGEKGHVKSFLTCRVEQVGKGNENFRPRESVKLMGSCSSFSFSLTSCGAFSVELVASRASFAAVAAAASLLARSISAALLSSSFFSRAANSVSSFLRTSTSVLRAASSLYRTDVS